MRKLTAGDRFWRANARWMDRPILHFVASQQVLRVAFELSARLGSALPPEITPIRDAQGALWFRPRGVDRDAPLLMYIHGGGFTIGSPRTHAALVAHLAKAAGLRAVAVPYRLAPEHPFPAAKHDVIAAFQRLVDAGTPPVALAGDSAGGCLALQVAQHARDAGAPMPKALALIGPIADFSDAIETRFAEAADEILIPPQWARRIQKVFLNATDPATPEVSPLLGNLKDLPPTLIHVGSGEALAQDARRLTEAMDDARLDLWEALPHVWHLHAGRSAVADRALNDMGAFLAEQISR